MWNFWVAAAFAFLSNWANSTPVKSEHRTAVLMTGMFRSFNTTLNDQTQGKAPQGSFDIALKDHNEKMYENLLENIIAPLSSTGVDVFMFVTTAPFGQTVESVLPNCKLFLNSTIFNKETGNKLFCIHEPETDIMDPFLKQFEHLRYYFYQSNEGHFRFMQQLYGMWKCNQLVRKYEVIHNFSYTYKVRLRFDNPFIGKLPSVLDLKFKPDEGQDPYEKGCNRYIICHDPRYSGGWQDAFNIGLAKDMDERLNFYQDFINGYFPYPEKTVWGTERYLHAVLLSRGICLVPDKRFFAGGFRTIDHKEAMDSNQKDRDYNGLAVNVVELA